jgi:acetylornithine deacetylase/succinyl-diaminopimelate desuccinylase-like protein
MIGESNIAAIREAYIAENKDKFLEELLQFLRIPSVSTDSQYRKFVFQAAQFVHDKLLDAGATSAEIIETQGYPIVYAEKFISPTLPTVLMYGHYDVQPPDPLELWDSPPFDPVIKNDKIYARGACDDKGQIYMHIKALEVMVKTSTLPCNIKFMIEGEEEIGSVNLYKFVDENREKIKSDVIIISDTGLISNDVPSINVGLRGLSYMEVEVTGPNRDLHSGLYGGTVANPIHVLARIIDQLKDDDGRITIPGFYDDVVELDATERDLINSAPFSPEEFKDSIGIKEIVGEKGYSALERMATRPTLDVNGIWGGYIQEGAKTVIPSKAYAKISMRLVPNQNSEKISQLFYDHFFRLLPSSASAKVSFHHGGEPVVVSTDSKAYRAASKAMETTFGKTPIPTRGGGSIPIVAMFKNKLGLDSILMGFGLDSDAIHSPNEHYGVWNFMKGIETLPYFYQYYMDINS